ncbi:hypothetical protein SAMN05216353_11816 [Halobacillus alkaliphilus]|uniref:Uncharacterized protein n=1 Tax=Halobacillus alkaliphilus TaxID=396056 RepID=A0A1I2NC14_9BACI|nr:hypothetical protein [Halobacillus alkaliphilus]SFG00399.1 hypothetical protein SAMN05216353_11816 [Halobacillus alkaliphilus]
MIRWGFWIGTTSGLVLGFYMWLVELVTGEKVYTLLMNVDFIPVIGSIEWPVAIEWLFHLIISWIIGVLYVYAFRRVLKDTKGNRWSLALILSAFAATSYVPLTLLAIKETPALTDGAAILYWLIGHVLYAVVLKISYYRS